MFFPYSYYEPSFHSSNFDKIISLNEETLEQNEPLIKSYVEKFSNQTKPVVFVLTGKSNDLYGLIDMDGQQRQRRDVLDDDDDNASSNGIIEAPKTNPCIYVYAKKIEFFDEDSINHSFNWSEVSLSDANCNNDTGASITLDLKSSQEDLSLMMSFKFDESILMWKIESIEIKDPHDKDNKKSWSTKNITNFVESGFSFSCSEISYMVGFNYTLNQTSPAKIVFTNFQIQPFTKSNSPYIFEDSEDCALWFTLPIIASLFVCLLFILIIFCGIRALMSILTPDRFENPKSKGLILTGVEE